MKYFVLECNRNPDLTLMCHENNPYAGMIIDYCINLKEKKKIHFFFPLNSFLTSLIISFLSFLSLFNSIR